MLCCSTCEAPVFLLETPDGFVRVGHMLPFTDMLTTRCPMTPVKGNGPVVGRLLFEEDE